MTIMGHLNAEIELVNGVPQVLLNGTLLRVWEYTPSHGVHSYMVVQYNGAFFTVGTSVTERELMDKLEGATQNTQQTASQLDTALSYIAYLEGELRNAKEDLHNAQQTIEQLKHGDAKSMTNAFDSLSIDTQLELPVNSLASLVGNLNVADNSLGSISSQRGANPTRSPSKNSFSSFSFS